MTEETTRVFLADDHAILRDGLSALVRSQADMEVVGEACDGESARTQIAALCPDVAVLDVGMPNGSGIDVIRALRDAGSSTRFIVLSMHEEPSYLRAALSSGAGGYVAKRTAARDLLLAIRTVHRGQSYVDPLLAPAVVAQAMAITEPNKQAVNTLTRREREVFSLVAQGFTNREIGEQLNISKKSVDTYRSRLSAKLHITSRAELVRIAAEAGLLQLGTDGIDS